jgi:hypothetical protein
VGRRRGKDLGHRLRPVLSEAVERVGIKEKRDRGVLKELADDGGNTRTRPEAGADHNRRPAMVLWRPSGVRASGAIETGQ